MVLMESCFQIHDNLTRLVPQLGIWEICGPKGAGTSELGGIDKGCYLKSRT